MINQLLKPIEQRIKNLPFVHVYGGLVRPVSRVVENENGVRTYEIFPVSHEVSHDDCWYNGLYQMLIPNDSYASIFYFEDITGLRYEGPAVGMSQRYQLSRFRGTVRLVGWLNLPMLGTTDAAISSLVAIQLSKTLNVRFQQLEAPFKINQIEYRVIGEDNRNENPFTKYSYGDEGALLLYPYDYVSIQVELNAIISLKCFDGVTLDSSYECITL